MNVQPFMPQGTTTISATQANASTLLTTNAVGAPACACYMITNAGPNTVFHTVTTGNGTAAVATSTPVLAGAIMIFSTAVGADTINTICNTGQTATVYVTPGEGQ